MAQPRPPKGAAPGSVHWSPAARTPPPTAGEPGEEFSRHAGLSTPIADEFLRNVVPTTSAPEPAPGARSPAGRDVNADLNCTLSAVTP